MEKKKIKYHICPLSPHTWIPFAYYSRTENTLEKLLEKQTLHKYILLYSHSNLN